MIKPDTILSSDTSELPIVAIHAEGDSITWAHPDTFVRAEEYEKLLGRVQEIEKRLAILQPNETLQEKYPVLQEAYDAYKIIEKLVNGNEGA